MKHCTKCHQEINDNDIIDITTYNILGFFGILFIFGIIVFIAILTILKIAGIK